MNDAPSRSLASPAGSAERLAALRAELDRRGLDGFLVPRADEHQGEYVSPRAERLLWLTGFTGSAGLAVVLRDSAAIFVDGRYTLQAEQEVDTALYTPRHLTEEPVGSWISERLKGGKLGYDPWLHTADQVTRLGATLKRSGATLVTAEPNPLDAVWLDQPEPPLAPVVPHDLIFAGESSADKRSKLAGELRCQGVGAAVLTMPDSIAWLLNVRGGDVPRTPLPLSFAIVDDEGQVDWFVDARKITDEVPAHLGNGVRVRPPEDLAPALKEQSGRKVRVDPSSAAQWIFTQLEAAGAEVQRGDDPCLMPKARKNPTEMSGARAAHRRDGVALTTFLAWLTEAAPEGGVTELAASDRLYQLRAPGERFRDLSFDTISGSGPQSAVIHYRVTPKTDRELKPGELYLVDSGAQYLDGTTDVTRTIAVGEPSAEMRHRYTLVLKGHIAIATARFPDGTTGSQLDSLARRPLWNEGLDFDHGTGHGVGSYLSVHEGPQRISKVPNRVALKPGMIVSNEPGYYKPGAYGIRIENLVAVQEAESRSSDERKMLAFETLTLAPFDRSLIDVALLDESEISWVDHYHKRVKRELAPLVEAEAKAWLETATTPLEKG
ncbi:aminopeptidase P family protein [Algihabitans albus]|uniref:aminopeptidase P family protein n=1 Tax=Algihabitans albus TaxID=2164067 RepID=UPI000E5D534C|nr:aminopeptidase P family protein [Algihabitans albus]